MMSVVTARSSTAARAAAQPGRGSARRCSRGACATSVRSLPDCNGRCRCSHTDGHSAIAAIVSGRRSFGCGDVNRTRLEAVDRVERAQQIGELRRYCPAPRSRPYELTFWPSSVISTDAVGDELLDLVHDVTHAAADLGAAHDGHDAEGARVVAADLDGDPRGVRDVTSRGQRRRIRLVLLEDLDDRALGARPARADAGACARLWVPNTTSTWPARSTISSRSFCARHPPTAIWRSGRSALSALSRPRWP